VGIGIKILIRITDQRAAECYTGFGFVAEKFPGLADLDATSGPSPLIPGSRPVNA
jgi:hypothetical protein